MPPLTSAGAWLREMITALEAWILASADAWWVHLAMAGFALVDAVLPMFPSESVLVTLASIWATTGHPNILIFPTAAWLGAWAGDMIAFMIGRTLGYERFRFFREGRGQRAVELARRGLETRAFLFIMTARYIPLGRTAVNMTAGAVHYSTAKFAVRSFVATFTWAVYGTAIGAVAGQWFEKNRLLGIVVSLAVAVMLSLVVERVASRLQRRVIRLAERAEEGAMEHDHRRAAEAADVLVRTLRAAANPEALQTEDRTAHRVTRSPRRLRLPSGTLSRRGSSAATPTVRTETPRTESSRTEKDET